MSFKDFVARTSPRILTSTAYRPVRPKKVPGVFEIGDRVIATSLGTEYEGIASDVTPDGTSIQASWYLRGHSVELGWPVITRLSVSQYQIRHADSD